MNVHNKPADLDETSLADLRIRLRAGELTAVQATQLYLERIAAIDKQVNAVIEINPDALAIAAQLDQSSSRGALREPDAPRFPRFEVRPEQRAS